MLTSPLSKMDLICNGLTAHHRKKLEGTGENKELIIKFLHSLLEERNIKPNTMRTYLETITTLSLYYDNVSFDHFTKEMVSDFLSLARKPESEDPLHRWVGTYNQYIIFIRRFFNWLKRPEVIAGINKFKRLETSSYKPSDMWSVGDDLMFLKYCKSDRDKAYHMIAGDLSCRPSEILGMRRKDVIFKTMNGKTFATVQVNGKTGSRELPLVNSIPYIKECMDRSPSKNPNSYLIYSEDNKITHPLQTQSIWAMYARTKKMFQILSDDPSIPKEDREGIKTLLQKPWNPYIQRHTALTKKSKLLKEFELRQHAGWSSRSHMAEKYIHYFNNSSSNSLLEAYGIKSKQDEINRMLPKQCPNCNTTNKIDNKFCSNPSCRLPLTYEAFEEGKKSIEDIIEKRVSEKMKALEESQREILECLKHPDKLAQIGQSE